MLQNCIWNQQYLALSTNSVNRDPLPQPAHGNRRSAEQTGRLRDPSEAHRTPLGGRNREPETQTFDCDKNINLDDEIANGCRTFYRENFDAASGTWRDRDCGFWPPPLSVPYGSGNLPPNAFDSQPRPDCIATEAATGNRIGLIGSGLVRKFETLPDGSAGCAPMEWPYSLNEDELKSFIELV